MDKEINELNVSFWERIRLPINMLDLMFKWLITKKI